MSFEMLPSLSGKLALAHRVLETIVLRTSEGAVFTISIGKSILPGDRSPIGAKVTLLSNPDIHIGICLGETPEQVCIAAQQMVEKTMQQGEAVPKKSLVPKPHISLGLKKSLQSN